MCTLRPCDLTFQFGQFGPKGNVCAFGFYER